jgi:hypothetical protein
MSEEIRHFKSDEEMTTGDWVEHARTGRRPERAEWRAARREALEDAGLEPDDDDPSQDAEEWSVEDHAARKYPNERNAA